MRSSSIVVMITSCLHSSSRHHRKNRNRKKPESRSSGQQKKRNFLTKLRIGNVEIKIEANEEGKVKRENDDENVAKKEKEKPLV